MGLFYSHSNYIETLGVQPDKDELCRKILLENNYRFVV